MTDLDAKERRLDALIAGPCVGSVWREGIHFWQVFALAPAVDKFGQIVYLNKVHVPNGALRIGTHMVSTLLRQRMVPVGIMPVGSI